MSKKKRKYAQDFSKGGFTEQSHKSACDINKIVKRYSETGYVPPGRNVRYGQEDLDYVTKQRMVAEAKSAWESLPGDQKTEYGDFQTFVDQEILFPADSPEPVEAESGKSEQDNASEAEINRPADSSAETQANENS